MILLSMIPMISMISMKLLNKDLCLGEKQYFGYSEF